MGTSTMNFEVHMKNTFKDNWVAREMPLRVAKLNWILQYKPKFKQSLLCCKIRSNENHFSIIPLRGIFTSACI